MDVRMMRVIWPVSGTARAMPGIAMRASHPPGSCVSAGRAPEAGSRCSVEENSRMNSTDSQNDGVAMQAMEKMRMTWSGQRSRYRADTTPRMALATMAMMKPKKPSCSVMGSAVAMRADTDWFEGPNVPRSPWKKPTM